MELLTSLAQNHLVDKIIPNGDLGGDISAHDTNQDTNEVPDEDAIKMFVGQVPRSMDEDALKEFFEEFGRVYQLNVLRDKNSGVSRGCCFVTFFKRKHALDAQNALHNVKTMPGVRFFYENNCRRWNEYCSNSLDGPCNSSFEIMMPKLVIWFEFVL